MKENEFDTVADTFRSKSVWRKDENDNWAKANIWDRYKYKKF